MDSYASESFRGQSAHFYSISTQNPLKLKSMWPFHNCSKEGCDWFTYVNDTLTAHLSSTLSSRGTPDSTSGLSMLRPDMRVIGQNQGSSGGGGKAWWYPIWLVMGDRKPPGSIGWSACPHCSHRPVSLTLILNLCGLTEVKPPYLAPFYLKPGNTDHTHRL